MQLEGKRIIVTGGSRGIGEALVQAYVREGAAVASLDVRTSTGQLVAEATGAAGPGRVQFQQCNVASRSEVFAAVDEAVRYLDGLDVMVNVAGISRAGNADTMTEVELDYVFDVNVMGTFFTNQGAFPHLRDKGGRILDFASAAGLNGYYLQAHYAASKAAVIGLVRSLAREWGKYNITVNAICPGMATPMYEEGRARRSPEERALNDARIKATTPIDGKMGDSERDLAPFMVFMAGDGSRYITGQTLMVDGGRTMSR